MDFPSGVGSHLRNGLSLKILYLPYYKMMVLFQCAPILFFVSGTLIKYRHSSFFHMLSKILLFTLKCFQPQPLAHPVHIYSRHSLLRPLEFHPRLGGESLHHSLLLLREDKLEAGAWCGRGYGKGILDLIRAWMPHKKLIIHNAQAGGKSIPETTGQVDKILPLLQTGSSLTTETQQLESSHAPVWSA